MILVAGDDFAFAAVHDRCGWPGLHAAAPQAGWAAAGDGALAAAAPGWRLQLHGAEPGERLAQAAVAVGDEKRQSEHAAPRLPFGDDVVAFGGTKQRQRQRLVAMLEHHRNRAWRGPGFADHPDGDAAER